MRLREKDYDSMILLNLHFLNIQRKHVSNIKSHYRFVNVSLDTLYIPSLTAIKFCVSRFACSCSTFNIGRIAARKFASRLSYLKKD